MRITGKDLDKNGKDRAITQARTYSSKPFYAAMEDGIPYRQDIRTLATNEIGTGGIGSQSKESSYQDLPHRDRTDAVNTSSHGQSIETIDR